MFLAWFYLLADNYLSAPLSLSLLSVFLQSVSTFIHRAHGLHSLLRTQLLRNSLRRPSDISTRSLHPPSVSSSHQHGLVVQKLYSKTCPANSFEIVLVTSSVIHLYSMGPVVPHNIHSCFILFHYLYIALCFSSSPGFSPDHIFV